MKSLKDIFLIAAVGIASALLSGCILIPVAGFGYTGYQYEEKKGVFAPGQPLGGSGADAKDGSGGKSTSSTSKGPSQSNNNIE